MRPAAHQFQSPDIDMADAGDDDDKCFGDTLPSLDPCDAEYQEMCVKKIQGDKLLAPFYASKCTSV